MRLTRAAGLLLLAAARAPGHEPDAGFAPTLPAAVGDVSDWEVVTGDFETAQIRGSYRLYVNPVRLAMYQLMRYQVEVLGPASGEYRRASGERVAFVRHPGTTEPMLLWARDAAVAGTSWRSVTPDQDEYRAELGILMRVLAIHRAVRVGTAPAAGPGELHFAIASCGFEELASRHRPSGSSLGGRPRLSRRRSQPIAA
jgi:hypothetical protein